MENEEIQYSYNYVPGRSVEQLEEERLIQHLKLSYEERFQRMIALINLTRKLKISPLTPKVNNGHT
jgi:hypothetical protein